MSIPKAVASPDAASSGSSGGLLSFLTTHHCQGVCAHDSCFLSVIRGFRHGAWYGAKIRFPHALVMTFLFRGGSFSDKVRDILNATYQHSRNLALYVSLYKLITCLMRHFRGVESPLNSLVGGAIGGAIMFGTNNPVNSQINMYVMSRVILGGVKALSSNGYLPTEEHIPHAYTIYAATTWALVMYLFEFQQKHLQKSLTTSMTYLYQSVTGSRLLERLKFCIQCSCSFELMWLCVLPFQREQQMAGVDRGWLRRLVPRISASNSATLLRAQFARLRAFASTVRELLL